MLFNGKKNFVLFLLLSVVTLSSFVIMMNKRVFRIQDSSSDERLNQLSPTIIPETIKLWVPKPPYIFEWSRVPDNQIKTNKNVLHWSIDLRECSGKAISTCKYPDKYYSRESTLSGKEWVFYKTINNHEDGKIYDYIILSLVRDISEIKNWSRSELNVKKGYSLTPKQGAQSATYQPECVHGVVKDNIRVACLTTIVPEESTKGVGMGLTYIFPYTEEHRFFISDEITISSLISEMKLD